jgi:putative sterol carrier protein
MVQSFKPEAAAGKSVVIQYELGTPDGVRAYTLTVDNGTCTLDKSGTDSARVTMQMAIQDFLRLAAGDLDGMKAFMGGKLKLKGDMMFAQQMQNWFGQS